mgnify:CR=1 FL=1
MVFGELSNKMGMNMNQALRQKTLARRDLLSTSQQTLNSEQIRSRLLARPEVNACRTFLVYVNFRSEVQTLDLITELLGQGRVVAVPLTRVAARELLPVQITDPSQQLVPGYCGIPEPLSDYAEQHQIGPTTIEVVIVPGSVFDQYGGRLGYGGGYYDRFLADRAPGALRVGLAHDLQVVSRLDLAPHDQLLDLLVTECREISSCRF